MRSEIPGRALARRSVDLLIASGVILVAGAFLGVVGWAFFVIPLQVPSNPGFGTYDSLRHFLLILAAILVVVGLALGIRAATWRQDNPLAQQTANELAQALNQLEGFDAKDFVFVRNISKLRLGYIDAALVGPPGVLVLRITAREGIYYNEGKSWTRKRDEGKWQVLRWNPTAEVVRDIHKLRDYFGKKGLYDVPVFGGIVFTQPQPAATISQDDNPVVPAMHIDAITQKLASSYFAQSRLKQGVRIRIVNLLMT